MKTRCAVNMIVVVILLAAFGALAIFGLNIGALEIKPLVEGISQGLDLRGGVSAVYEAQDEGQSDFASLLSGTMAVLRNRLTNQGFTEATVTQQGTNRIRIEIPDVDDPNEILNIIGQPAHLEFKTADGETIMDGSAVVSAEMGYLDGQPVVQFTLNDEGATAFATATAENVGSTISIELDGEVISAPTVNQAITGGQGYIEGNFTAESAQQLAMLIQSGALPLDIEQIEVRTISATLGEDALSTSMTAAVIGVLLVIVFMLVIYRLPGVMASLALLIYILIDLFLLAVIPGVQLTLPGIAGIVLSIGMAVDANVIIFERMKEEMRAGKTVRASVESGFKRAFSAILDSNITTIIAGLVLMIFGAGTIKGFAITLTIGVVCSMFTAVVVTRFLLRQMVGLNFTNHRLYGVRDAKEGRA
ncbi:MAG TPA: protein translocase subunit SecD [Candidatus Spyradocola merdavium]|nr:protein translocase subunit SecD [Candidatus Spyradocola merdavium]